MFLYSREAADRSLKVFVFSLTGIDGIWPANESSFESQSGNAQSNLSEFEFRNTLQGNVAVPKQDEFLW